MSSPEVSIHEIGRHTRRPSHHDVFEPRHRHREPARAIPRTTRVGRGENSGRTLTEFNIVRQFRMLGPWTGRETVFRVPLDAMPADATHVAVLLQRTDQGRIAGSATVALR